MSAVRTLSPEMIGIREFARRDGCDDKLVRKAIRDGHLPQSPDKKIDARLVGTGWRSSNRRAADTRAEKGADSAESPRTLRTPAFTASAIAKGADKLADLAGAVAYEAAVVLLPALPRPVLEPLLTSLVQRMSMVAADLLQEGGVAPPSGLSTWRAYRSFSHPLKTMNAADWLDAAEEAGADV